MVTRDRFSGAVDAERFRLRLETAARQAGRPLTAKESEGLTTHYRLLRQWGERMNLTGLKDEESILRRHFLEPLAAASLIKGEGVLLDIGSGNGFPAVPLAILHPGIQLVLVEASEKKSGFLWTVIREIGLSGARVETRRLCRRADLADFLPVRWLSFRGIRVEEILAGSSPDLLEKDGRLLAFISDQDARRMTDSPPSGLTKLESVSIPTSPGDLIVVFAPSGD